MNSKTIFHFENRSLRKWVSSERVHFENRPKNSHFITKISELFFKNFFILTVSHLAKWNFEVTDTRYEVRKAYDKVLWFYFDDFFHHQIKGSYHLKSSKWNLWCDMMTFNDLSSENHFLEGIFNQKIIWKDTWLHCNKLRGLLLLHLDNKTFTRRNLPRILDTT